MRCWCLALNRMSPSIEYCLMPSWSAHKCFRRFFDEQARAIHMQLTPWGDKQKRIQVKVATSTASNFNNHRVDCSINKAIKVLALGTECGIEPCWLIQSLFRMQISCLLGCYQSILEWNWYLTLKAIGIVWLWKRPSKHCAEVAFWRLCLRRCQKHHTHFWIADDTLVDYGERDSSH